MADMSSSDNPLQNLVEDSIKRCMDTHHGVLEKLASDMAKAAIQDLITAGVIEVSSTGWKVESDGDILETGQDELEMADVEEGTSRDQHKQGNKRKGKQKVAEEQQDKSSGEQDKQRPVEHPKWKKERNEKVKREKQEAASGVLGLEKNEPESSRGRILRNGRKQITEPAKESRWGNWKAFHHNNDEDDEEMGGSASREGTGQQSRAARGKSLKAPAHETRS